MSSPRSTPTGSRPCPAISATARPVPQPTSTTRAPGEKKEYVRARSALASGRASARSRTLISALDMPAMLGLQACMKSSGRHHPPGPRQNVTFRQASLAPAVPACPGSAWVLVACTTTDEAVRSPNAHGTLAETTPPPCSSVVKSSQTSLRGLAYAGSTDGWTGSISFWKCGPESLGDAPHGFTCTCAPYCREGRSP